MSESNLETIAYEELLERLSDPESDLEFYLRYMVETPTPGRMGVDLSPNPAFVTDIPPTIEGGVLVNLANGFMRRRRHRAYRRRIRNGWSGPRIVSEGDSWFQYPTKLQDIIDHLMKDNAILSLGAAGDELEDIQRQREILLNIDAEGASALLLSAGGNDLFDNGQLGDLIEEPFPGASGEDLVGETFENFLRGMVGQYLDLFRRVHRAFPHVHILIHGYAEAFPKDGAWIEKPLTKRGVDKETQHDVVRVIVKRFNDTLAKLAKRAEFHGKLGHIDATQIGKKPGDWHDEIHLNGRNAKKVADLFQAELDKRLTGPATESSMPIAQVPDPVLVQATQMAALDQGTLLRELDLRLRLIELDPSAVIETSMPLLHSGRAEIEIGIASIRKATRKLIDHWLADLREVICGGAAPDNFLEQAIVGALDKGKAALSAAVAGWLVTGPLGVPGALASALAAWLAGEVLESGKDRLCATWVPFAPPTLGPAVESAMPTMGEARERFRRPDGSIPDFGADFQKEELERLREILQRDVIDDPVIPIAEDAAPAFMNWAGTILAQLGGDADDAPLPPEADASVEAVVLMDGTRPALYVRDGTVDLSDPKLDASGFKPDVEANLPAIEQQIAATGRVLQGADRSADRVFGTAWMLENGRVATAKHVLEAMAVPFGDQWFLNSTYFVDFAVEADRAVNPDAVFRIESVDFASPDMIAGQVSPPQLDIATFKLVPRNDVAFPEPVPLAGSEDADILDGERPKFFNVGHPGQPRGSWLVDGDDGNAATLSRDLLFALIGDKFGVKRFSPGMIMSKPGIFGAMGGAADSVFLHDATTLGGSSGSSLMMQGKTGMVSAGLHFAGQFGTRNYAHWVPAIREPLE